MPLPYLNLRRRGLAISIDLEIQNKRSEEGRRRS
jgi:hypothetical protein